MVTKFEDNSLWPRSAEARTEEATFEDVRRLSAIEWLTMADGSLIRCVDETLSDAHNDVLDQWYGYFPMCELPLALEFLYTYLSMKQETLQTS